MVRIAVTGHMDITPATETLVYRGVTDELSRYTPTEVTGVSCLARGADSVFARAVVDYGGILDVVLPARRYRELKVKPDHAPVFDELLGRAAVVRVMDFDEPNRDAYEAANTALLERADCLIAVWDGMRGARGGTASVVEVAEAGNIPVVVVWPVGAQRHSSR